MVEGAASETVLAVKGETVVEAGGKRGRESKRRKTRRLSWSNAIRGLSRWSPTLSTTFHDGSQVALRNSLLSLSFLFPPRLFNHVEERQRIFPAVHCPSTARCSTLEPPGAAHCVMEEEGGQCSAERQDEKR